MSLDFSPALHDFDGDGRDDLLVHAFRIAPSLNVTVDNFVAYSSDVVEERTTDDLVAGVGGLLWLGGGSRLQPLGGDADGDGQLDYVLASPDFQTPARVLTRLPGDPPYAVADAIGWDLDCPDEHISMQTSPVGDVNGDGHVDVAVVCVLSSVGAGATTTFVAFAGPGGTDVDLETLGERGLTIVDGDTDETGGPRLPAAAGDVDGDGLDDFVVGPGERMSIVRGRDSAATISLAEPECAVWCDAEATGCGAPSVASLGDLDDDGASEVAIAVGSDVYVLFDSVCDAGHTGLDERVDAGTAAVIRIPTAVARLGGREPVTNELVFSVARISLDPDDAEHTGVYSVALPTAGSVETLATLVESGAARKLDGPYGEDLNGHRVGLAGEYLGSGSAAVVWSTPGIDDVAMEAGRVTIERVAP